MGKLKKKAKLKTPAPIVWSTSTFAPVLATRLTFAEMTAVSTVLSRNPHHTCSQQVIPTPKAACTIQTRRNKQKPILLHELLNLLKHALPVDTLLAFEMLRSDITGGEHSGGDCQLGLKRVQCHRTHVRLPYHCHGARKQS